MAVKNTAQVVIGGKIICGNDVDTIHFTSEATFELGRGRSIINVVVFFGDFLESRRGFIRSKNSEMPDIVAIFLFRIDLCSEYGD